MALDLDMSQFHDIFFEESTENLEVMEASLLGLDIGNPDPEVINTIFRAAHSIKGGAGTFGFTDIADFTHVVETSFDEVREQKRDVTRIMVDVVLESVDCIRYMIAQCKAEQPIDEEKITELKEKLISLPTEEPESSAPAQEQTGSKWHIHFRPHEYLLKTGNDPYRLFRELAELGEMQIRGETDKLPQLQSMDPELCYMKWYIQFSADVARRDIEEVFEWVDGDCDLHIELEGERRRKVDRRAGGRREEDKHAQSAVALDGQLSGQEASSIRVNTEKVDNLVNLVGELVITVSMLSRFSSSSSHNEVDREKLKESVEQLERNTRDLQEQTMNIRMLPIDFVFQRLPRLVHDLSQSLGKQVELKISGNATEIDKTVLEKIGDPLVHLIRNSLDHGIETPELREAAGKNPVGTIELEAYHEGGNIVIKITDDGAGLDPEMIRNKAIEKDLINVNDELTENQIQNLIFLPGFSTATQVSDVSGRGVGTDVVRSNIVELGGNVKVTSEKGVGTTFFLRLPLTLAIMDGQLIQVGNDIFVISLLSIIESTQIDSELVNAVAGKYEVYRYRDEYIPIIRLHEVFGIENANTELKDGLLVIIDTGQRVGLLVDDILGQQQVVIKSLRTNFRQIESLAGATILGDGTVAMIIDLSGLLRFWLKENDEANTTVAVELSS